MEGVVTPATKRGRLRKVAIIPEPEKGPEKELEDEHKNDCAPDSGPEKAFELGKDNMAEQVAAVDGTQQDTAAGTDNGTQSFTTRSGGQVKDTRTIWERGEYQEDITYANNSVSAKRQLKQAGGDFEATDPPQNVNSSPIFHLQLVIYTVSDFN